MTRIIFYSVYNMSDRLYCLVECCLLQLIFVFHVINLSQIVNKQWNLECCQQNKTCHLSFVFALRKQVVEGIIVKTV